MPSRAAPARTPARPLLPVLFGAVIAAACLGLGWFSSHYGGTTGILAAEALPSSTHFALLAFGAGATGMFLRHRRFRGALVVSIGTLLAVIGLTLAGQLFPASYGTGSYRSPDGRHEFRVTDGASTTDPAQRLRVQETRGLWSRYWDVGCVSGSAVRDVHWSSPEQLQLTVNGVQRTLRMAPEGPLPNPALHTC